MNETLEDGHWVTLKPVLWLWWQRCSRSMLDQFTKIVVCVIHLDPKWWENVVQVEKILKVSFNLQQPVCCLGDWNVTTRSTLERSEAMSGSNSQWFLAFMAAFVEVWPLTLHPKYSSNTRCRQFERLRHRWTVLCSLRANVKVLPVSDFIKHFMPECSLFLVEQSLKHHGPDVYYKCQTTTVTRRYKHIFIFCLS